MNYSPIKKMKNLFFKTISAFSLLTLGFLNTEGALSGIQFGSNSTRPDSLKVTYYEMGLTNSDFTKVFSVLKSSAGVEADIADQNSVDNLASGIKAMPGTYTHIYSVISNTYKVKGSSNGCYTKGSTLNMSNSSFNASQSTKDGNSNWCNNCAFDAWSAATSNINEFGEAVLTEQAFGVGEDGNRDGQDGYSGTPLTSISVGGLEAQSMKIYLTNSSAPYSYVPEGTALNDMPASSTRDRALYVGELASPLEIEEGSKGIVQLYFDFSNGLAFDDDCDAIKFNSGDFNMTVLTE